MPFAAVADLENRLKRPGAIFEFGSGGSTFFFASRGHRVVTVEHDRKWHEQILKKIRAENWSDVEAILREPSAEEQDSWDPSDPDRYHSGVPAYQGFSFRSYAAVLDDYPDAFFDLVLVDGRARPSCIKHALPKVRPGGCLVLDDAGRPRYRSARTLPSPLSWKLRIFRGLRPYPFQRVSGSGLDSFREFPIGSAAFWEKRP